jgi:hypothetical protein
MVVKLGNFGDVREYKTLSWKDFKKSEYFELFKKMVSELIKANGEARFLIERILKGGKYPSVAIVWTAISNDKEVVRVKLSLQKEKFKDVLKALGIKKLDECGSALDFVLFLDKETKKIVYGVDKSIMEGCYKDMGSYYDFVATSDEDKDEDIDFDF